MAKKNRKGGGAGKNLKVDEAVRVQIMRTLESFVASRAEVYKFEDGLSNAERALVHLQCSKMGLRSKSQGRGKQRRISVFKPKKKEENGPQSAPALAFSEEAREILQDLFVNYPPDDEDGIKDSAGRRCKTADKSQHRRSDEIFCRPVMRGAEIAKKVESLASRMESVQRLRQIAEARSKLPISSFKDEITSTVASHQVVLISGETGCGKTTQVPQFLLDYMWGKGETCKIVCTQPRRLSAMSVAERIAAERGEDIGENIGYKIRLESKGGRHSSVLFCTNGILLRVLVAKGVGVEARQKKAHEISEMTHIIMDEIHERDCYSDFMLAILRDLLPSYPHIRLILMSATLDAERFSQYFGGCPIICVPGFTYPVKAFYLEDVLSILKLNNDNHLDNDISCGTHEESELTEEHRLALDEAIDLAWSNDDFEPLLEFVSSEGTRKVYDYQHSLSGLTSLMVFAGKGRVGEVCMLLSFGADCKLRANDGATALELAVQKDQEEIVKILKRHIEGAPLNSQEEQELLDKYLAEINPELIDVVLIERLLVKICTGSEDGAVLVFLPGWDDINKTRDRLLANPLFKDASKFLILALHSMVPSIDQKKVFHRTPPGCRKIVLSTNIAETAITIDDVVYVIDTGRLKEKSYDPYSNVSTLQSSWVSKASAKQREGRAGRCQPGICYHLCSKLRAASLPEFQLPEIRRMPMEELCLQVKLLNPDCRIEDFLQKTLDPPLSETIRNAVVLLEDIGALSPGENLTELGEKLGSLPLHPVTSKMLLFAILMNCLDPALTTACASDYKDPFTLPMFPDQKIKVNEAKGQLSSLLGGHSDQLAIVAAFDCWRNAKERGQESCFCSKYFISSSTMQMLSRMRKLLQRELQRNGFISEAVSNYSLNARNPGILHAVLVAGLYPKVGRLLPFNKQRARTAVETADTSKVRVHPQSVNCKLSLKETGSPLVVYDEIVRGDNGSVIRNCTIVGPLPLMFLSTEMAAAPATNDEDYDSGSDDNESDEDDNNEDVAGGRKGDKLMSSPDNAVVVVLDRWLYFRSTALDVAQIYLLRERLSAAILFMVNHPRDVLPPVLGVTVYAIACILSFDGLSGISLPAQPVDSQTSAPTQPVDSKTSTSNATAIGKSEKGRRVLCPTTDVFLRSLFMNGVMPDSDHRSNFRDSTNLRAPSGPSNDGPSNPPFTAGHSMGSNGLNGGYGSTPSKREGTRSRRRHNSKRQSNDESPVGS